MMMYEKLIHECENLLRAGQLPAVARRLGGLKPAQVPREFRRPLATICRRANLVTTGLKLLSPVVRGSRKGFSVLPQPVETAEYGALLYRLGAISEALRLLESVDTREAPEALLYQAFCYFNQWEYAEALPILETYLRAPLSSYATVVGCVNICAALVGTRRWDAARTLINDNLSLTRHEGLWRLHGNCLELSAQVYVAQGQFAKARAELQLAADLVRDEKSTDQLYIQKWTAILDAGESGDAEPILKFAAESARRQEWESVREADLFALKVRFDEARFQRLIFGTPFLPYRDKIMTELGRKPALASYLLGGEGPILDLRTGEVEGADARLKPATAVHRVLETLSRDFYRPTSLGGLFSSLFPGEYFDVYTSPSRVHQLLRRTRRWLEENSLPVRLQSLPSGYRLQVDGGFALRIPLERSPVSQLHLQWDRLVRHFGKAPYFTAWEGRAALSLPPTSFKRLIRWAMERQLVVKRGGGSNVIYRLAG